MSERDKVASFMLKLRKVPRSWWYKIPDVRTCGNCGKVATSDKRPFDVIGSLDGMAIAIEFKMPGAKLSPHQEAQLRLFAHTGGVSLVVYLHPGGELVQRMDGQGVLIAEPRGLLEFLETILYIL